MAYTIIRRGGKFAVADGGRLLSVHDTFQAANEALALLGGGTVTALFANKEAANSNPEGHNQYTGTYNGVDVKFGKKAYVGDVKYPHDYIADAHGANDDDLEGAETHVDSSGKPDAVALTHVHPKTGERTRLSLFKHPQTGEWHKPEDLAESQKVWDYRLRDKANALPTTVADVRLGSEARAAARAGRLPGWVANEAAWRASLRVAAGGRSWNDDEFWPLAAACYRAAGGEFANHGGFVTIDGHPVFVGKDKDETDGGERDIEDRKRQSLTDEAYKATSEAWQNAAKGSSPEEAAFSGGWHTRAAELHHIAAQAYPKGSFMRGLHDKAAAQHIEHGETIAKVAWGGKSGHHKANDGAAPAAGTGTGTGTGIFVAAHFSEPVTGGRGLLARKRWKKKASDTQVSTNQPKGPSA